MDCDTAQGTAIAYATAGLGAAEAQELLAHLAHCPACCTYLRDVTAALQLLPYGLPPVEPPRALRERVLRAAAREHGRPWAGGLEGSGRGLRDRAPGIAPGLRRLRASLPAAVAALFLLSAGLLWQSRAENRRLADRLEAAALQLQAASTLLGEGPTRPVQTIALQKEASFPESWGHLTLYDTRYGYVAVVAVGGLPAPAPGEVYRIWLLSDGKRWDGGSFRPDGAGYGALVLQRKAFDFDGIGITREPDPRPAPGPRGPRVLSGRL